MTVVPDKLFVNLYPPVVGPCVGSAYATRELADRNANSHRLMCVELSARPANSVIVSEELFETLNAFAKHNDCEVAEVIAGAIEVHRAIPTEVRVLLRRYAAEQNIKFATAIAECCRAYLTEEAR